MNNNSVRYNSITRSYRIWNNFHVSWVSIPSGFWNNEYVFETRWKWWAIRKCASLNKTDAKGKRELSWDNVRGNKYE